MKQLFFFLFLVVSCSIQAQTHKYNIVLFGDVIGSGSAKGYQSNGYQNYELKTKAQTKVMFKDRTSETDIDMSFKGGILYSCNLKREKDGEWQNIKISYENGSHYFIEDGKKVKVAKTISYTTTQFFFKEPVGVKEVYVERLNVFAPVEKVEEGLYKTVVDGGDNYYRYENGVLVEFRLKKGVNIYMNKV